MEMTPIHQGIRNKEVEMSVQNMFKEFLENLKVTNAEQISNRYGEITSSLNKKFRDTESKESNSLKVGSYGRYTGIKGISDLDMLYIMPKSLWDDYKDGGQSQLLTDAKDAIKTRYPNTNVKVDRLVVTVTYKDFHVEVQPVFEETDEEGNVNFKYPDTYNGGSWKVTKPKQEMQAVKDLNEEKNKNLRLLCKMARAWKNHNGVVMGGLLIDTLAYNFLKTTDLYNDKSYLYFDKLSRDFFEFLKDQEDKDHYKAPGSNQNVKVRKKFQRKADEAYKHCLKAIEAEGKSNVNNKWKKVYGRNFPLAKEEQAKAKSVSSVSWDNTEEYIEDYYPVDIKFSIKVDCEVKQKGSFRKMLSEILSNGWKIPAPRTLLFRVVENDVPPPFTLKWKVLNRGMEAKKRNCIRGQIHIDGGDLQRKEPATFSGDHVVECYVIKDEIVVARQKISVPIE